MLLNCHFLTSSRPYDFFASSSISCFCLCGLLFLHVRQVTSSIEPISCRRPNSFGSTNILSLCLCQLAKIIAVCAIGKVSISNGLWPVEPQPATPTVWNRIELFCLTVRSSTVQAYSCVAESATSESTIDSGQVSSISPIVVRPLQKYLDAPVSTWFEAAKRRTNTRTRLTQRAPWSYISPYRRGGGGSQLPLHHQSLACYSQRSRTGSSGSPVSWPDLTASHCVLFINRARTRRLRATAGSRPPGKREAPPRLEMRNMFFSKKRSTVAAVCIVVGSSYYVCLNTRCMLPYY